MKQYKTIKALGFFVVILLIAFGSATWFTSTNLAKEAESLENQIRKDQELAISTIQRQEVKKLDSLDETEWILLSTGLLLYIQQAKVQGEAKVAYVQLVVNNAYNNDIQAIAKALDNYNSPNNIIRKAVVEAVEDLFFNGIHSDNTDGFVVIGEKVSEDGSSNCVSYGSTRSFYLEMLMHANPALGFKAFTDIANGNVKNYSSGAMEGFVIFQFVTHPDGVDMQKDYENILPEHQGKLGLELISYDLAGLKDYFMKTKSWEKTFMSFEFVTPSYIFDTADLAGRNYIKEGTRTDIPRLSLNVVFNYKTVIDNNPTLKKDLALYAQQRKQISIDAKKEIIQVIYKYQERQEQTHYNFLMKERMLYLVVILLVIICFIAMHYTKKLLEDTGGYSDGDIRGI
jgi:hypothetical protein